MSDNLEEYYLMIKDGEEVFATNHTTVRECHYFGQRALRGGAKEYWIETGTQIQKVLPGSTKRG